MKLLLDTHMLDKKETGNERYWKNLALALKKYYPEIKVFLYGNKILAKNIAFLKKFDGVFIPPSDNGLYRIFFGFNQAIEKFKPDLIHVQNFTPVKKTIPIVNTIHDLCFKNYPHFFNLKTNFAFKFFFKRSLDSSDKLICVSNSTKNQLLKHYPINPKKITIIYEAADPVFHFIKNKNMVKKYLEKKFGIKNNYFLVVGNLEKRKQPEEIIKAFNRVIKKIKNINLVFAGVNKLRIKETKNIKILNYVSDVDLIFLYNGALTLIYFSLCEGFGLPLVESMTTKTPIICSDIAVFREIAQSSANYINNTEDLSQAMARIIKNKSLKDKYSILVYKRSLSFSWQKTARKILKIYQEVL